MANHLFMASTPFNVLTASMIAFNLPEQDRVTLWLIDQELGNQFCNYLEQWQQAPFDTISVVSRRQKSSRKYQYRQKIMKDIIDRLDDIQPDHIYTGNDRRIEFQFAMSISMLKWNTRGSYVDDGTYSYIGRKTHWFLDGIIDNLIKKLVYGSWWSQPSDIGASRWISESWLAFPEAAIPVLRQKPIRALPRNLDRSEFSDLANIGLPAGINLSAIDGVLLLPHSSVGSASTATGLVEWLLQQPDVQHIAIKRHPRSAPGLAGIPTAATEIPASLPMEILLPLLRSGCLVTGTLSTALLTAKWLRPDLRVYAHLQNTVDADWQRLLQNIGVIIIGTAAHAS